MQIKCPDCGWQFQYIDVDAVMAERKLVNELLAESRELAQANSELAKWREIPQKLEKLIPCPNISLSAAQVRTTAILQMIDLIKTINQENQ
jgi:hypothetical protein